jgi:hypothetical protein
VHDPNATSVIPAARDSDPYATASAGDGYPARGALQPGEPDPARREDGADGPAVRGSTTTGGRNRLVIGIVLAAVVIAALVGVAYFMSGEPKAAEYKLGECVKQQGRSAILVDCGQPGVYRLDKQVPDKASCDPTQPFIVVDRKDGTKDTFCLTPQ